jgi:hypothetical protein
LTPQPRLSIESPANGAIVPASGFLIAGWAIDATATSGTGVNTVHLWAYPANGSTPTFLGAAAYGGARPDVAAAFGGIQFTNSGFGRNVVLPPGTYDLALFPYSTVANAFTAPGVRRVQVAAPTSIPRMWVDTPRENDNLSQNVVVAGWAIDVGDVTGGGVNTVHVWAYPAGGGAPQFVGAGLVNGSRPDVAAAFGSSRFGNSGFRVEGTLPPGGYTLVAYAYSTVVMAFNNVFVVPIRVF